MGRIYNEAQKRATYAWVEKNREKLNGYNNNYSKEKYYKEHKEERREYARRHYRYKTECQRLRNILLD